VPASLLSLVSQSPYMYQQYLQSEHWKQTKARKQRRTIKRCAICASFSDIQLHHLFYRKRLTETELSDLRWLCETCHSTAHSLINSGVIVFPKPESHHSCFTITKHHVKKSLGIEGVNMFNV
jgi:5-methylcytosine-specific restriction endonuclease McrA